MDIHPHDELETKHTKIDRAAEGTNCIEVEELTSPARVTEGGYVPVSRARRV